MSTEQAAAAERERAVALVDHLAGSVLESRRLLVGAAEVKWMLGRVAQELVILGGAVRDGLSVAEFERRLAAQLPPLRVGLAPQ